MNAPYSVTYNVISIEEFENMQYNSFYKRAKLLFGNCLVPTDIVAKIAGKTSNTILVNVKEGYLTPVNPDGKPLKFTLDEVLRYLEEGRK